MNLSKSKYCNAIQCKKMLWLDTFLPAEKGEISNQAILDNGTEVGIKAKELFGTYIDIDFQKDLSVMLNDTKKAIESNENAIITEASFDYNHNFCSVDILRKMGEKYEIYEVKSSTTIKDIYKDDAAYQYYVLSNLGLNVTKVSIVHINTEYVRHGDLDLNELFIKEDVTEYVKKVQNEVKNNIKSINEYLKQESIPKDDIDLNCFDPYLCPFFDYCTKDLPRNNVFSIAGMPVKNKMGYYKKGIISFEDLENQRINKNYKQQIEYELYDKNDYIDEEEIKKFLQELTEPLYFLDFETFQMPIPLYEGTSPYKQIPFQYSLHYIIDNKLFHKEFLANGKGDPRRDLAERLVQDIPRDTCVLAYNMSFEKTVIQSLAKSFPDLSEHLLNIHDNIKDLMIPFRKRYYYTRDMQGSYSIKYVLPALFPNEESLNYHNLELIHNGVEAMDNYAKLASLDEKEYEWTRERLLRYCELDTFAMVKIYEKLQEVTNLKRVLK